MIFNFIYVILFLVIYVKENFDKILEQIINEHEKNKEVPRVMLHSCCAPCSSYVIDYLSKYFKLTIFYYNPNISPFSEYEKRKKEQIRLINEMDTKYDVDIIDCDYDNDLYEEMVCGLENEPERGKRCSVCFMMRLEKTAYRAIELGYDYFGTTLTVSPYKNCKIINEIGLEIGKKLNINFLVSDFKKKDGYKKSIEFSHKYNLYRQNYCGCKYSKEFYEKRLLDNELVH